MPRHIGVDLSQVGTYLEDVRSGVRSGDISQGGSSV